MHEIEPFEAAGLEPQSVAGLQLLSVEQLRRLLLTVEREGWIVLGLDGFELVDDGVRPDFDQIADWSAGAWGPRSVERALGRGCAALSRHGRQAGSPLRRGDPRPPVGPSAPAAWRSPVNRPREALFRTMGRIGWRSCCRRRHGR